MLSGGNSPTGTVTFTLYNPSDTLVDTETVGVDGNGTYTTPEGYTLPTSGTVTGTYQWDASYSGDTFNTGSSDDNDSAEQVVVNDASPTLTSTPSATSITLSKTAPTLKDTATLSGGYYPGGTITFTLYYDGGATPIDTETVGVSGNGTYTTPEGYTLPTSGTVTGTYQWDASYSGDSSNTGSSDDNDPAEQVVVNDAAPTLTSTPSATSITLSKTASDAQGHRHAVGWLLPDRHDHLHALLRRGCDADRHRDGERERERHVHDADGVQAPEHEHRGHRHLPVGRHLQR